MFSECFEFGSYDVRQTLSMYDKFFLSYEWGTTKTFSSMTGQKGTVLTELTKQLASFDHLIVQARFCKGDADNSTEVEVNGYVIAGWTCTAPPELPGFDGLWTPIDRPVLLLNGQTNRWRRQADWDGSCAEKAGDHRDVTSLEIDTYIENLFVHPAGRTALIAFLHTKLLR
jgi:hypothetical protein